MAGAPLKFLHAGSSPRQFALLEGKWLGQSGKRTLVATNPVGVLEGDKESLREFPQWLAWHAGRYPGGAAIGYFAYELARYFEDVHLARFDTLPDVSFTFFSETDTLPPRTAAPLAAPASSPEIHTQFDEESFARAVNEIRNYIAAGDIYQANLTQQFLVRLKGLSPAQVYQNLAADQASFSAYLQSSNRTVISNSPERFFRVAGRRILASPIKGTIARGRSVEEDAQQKAALLASQKDLAENVMIADLLRNDLGRICEYGSIRTRLYELDPLPQLFHLVSHVHGKLRPEVGVLDVVRALFPCGSITGAPKIRAMQILSEIEKVPRGVSMGAIGIIVGTPGLPHFQMDFNVAIRTMTVEDSTAIFNVGGGIVYDSEPGAEYQEMLLKARPLLKALGVLPAAETTATPARSTAG